jgi:hypothetical protein
MWNRTFGKPRSRWKIAGWIHLTQWRALVNTAMNLRFTLTMSGRMRPALPVQPYRELTAVRPRVDRATRPEVRTLLLHVTSSRPFIYPPGSHSKRFLGTLANVWATRSVGTGVL